MYMNTYNGDLMSSRIGINGCHEVKELYATSYGSLPYQLIIGINILIKD